MVRSVFGVFLIAATFPFALASGGTLDPRFDGRWVGVEMVQYQDQHRTTVIGIARSGTMVGVLAGFAPGRYRISPKSEGRTIKFSSSRRRCILELSPDGNTIKEHGYEYMYAWHFGVIPCQVLATFHRVAK